MANIRHNTRQYAVQSLYAHEFHENREDMTFPEGHMGKIDKKYAQLMINGVLSHTDQLDVWIQTYSKKWKVEHMDRVDRSILRLAMWEMKLATDILPKSIAINEAIQLAKEFGTDDSYKLVNGILDAFVKGERIV